MMQESNGSKSGPAAHQAPALGGEPAQRQAFREYLAAFSAGDVERFTAFYDPAVQLRLGGGIVLDGAEAIGNFYRNLFTRVREQLTLNRLIADQDGLAADITTTFTAHEDMPEFPIAPIRKGEAIRGRVFVHYTLKNGRIADIKVARSGPMSEPTPIEKLEPLPSSD